MSKDGSLGFQKQFDVIMIHSLIFLLITCLRDIFRKVILLKIEFMIFQQLKIRNYAIFLIRGNKIVEYFLSKRKIRIKFMHLSNCIIYE